MKKSDWILIIICLLASLFSAIYIYNRKQESAGTENIVCVTVDRGEFASLPLKENARLAIPTGDGNSILVIEDGRCFMETAHCPDQICVHHTAISAVGEQIICLPYKIIVEIKASEKQAEQDKTVNAEKTDSNDAEGGNPE